VDRLSYCREKLAKLVQGMTNLDASAVEELVRTLPIQRLPKGFMLVQQGGPVTESYYLILGCLRQFITSSNGKEISVEFYLEDQALNTSGDQDLEGLSLYSYACVEESYVIACNNGVIREVQSVPGDFGDMIRTFYGKHLTDLQKNFASMKALSPEERFLMLYRERRELFWRVPQHLLASYIDLTPETFSRYKRKHLKNGSSEPSI